VIIALGDIYAQIPRREQVSALMRALQDQVRGQPGCESYAFAETLDDPGHFVVVQHWRDSEALDEHYRSQACADYQAAVADQLIRTSELRLYVVQESSAPVESFLINTSHDD
jgi:quinol monooxygenase YgiN